MKSIFKRNDSRALGGIARDLDGIFNGPGAAVDKQCGLGEFAGHGIAKFGCQPDGLLIS